MKNETPSPVCRILDGLNAFMLALVGVLTVILVGTTFTGCSTPQTEAAYKISTGTDIGVKAALDGWNAYIPIGHPSSNDEYRVMSTFKTVQQGELAIIDASESLATNPTNTAPLAAAQAAEQAAQLDLIHLIASLTNSVAK